MLEVAVAEVAPVLGVVLGGVGKYNFLIVSDQGSYPQSVDAAYRDRVLASCPDARRVLAWARSS